jgi:hypothetical protein
MTAGKIEDAAIFALSWTDLLVLAVESTRLNAPASSFENWTPKSAMTRASDLKPNRKTHRSREASHELSQILNLPAMNVCRLTTGYPIGG